MRCLIVVDYQTDFVTESLGFPAALHLERPIAEKIARYHALGEQVVFTLNQHDAAYPLTRQGRELPMMHCRAETPGCELYGKVAQQRQPQDHCFVKHAYGSPELFDWLWRQQFDAVELVSVVTQVCVLSNAVLAQAALPETPIYVDPTCVASPDRTLHRAVLQVLEGLQMHTIDWHSNE